MKIILTTYLLLICNLTFSQVKFDYLKLENNQFFFERVYDCDSLNADEIETMLISNIPKLKNVTDFQNNQKIITAKINADKVNFKKYGGSSFSSSVFLGGDFFGNVSIVWKDKKYKVSVTNMYFVMAGFGKMTATDIFTKNSGAEMRTNRKVEESGNYIQSHLSDLFTINAVKKDW
jgi:hypothetical protein